MGLIWRERHGRFTPTSPPLLPLPAQSLPRSCTAAAAPPRPTGPSSTASRKCLEAAATTLPYPSSRISLPDSSAVPNLPVSALERSSMGGAFRALLFRSCSSAGRAKHVS